MECLINIVPLFVKTNVHQQLTSNADFMSVVETMVNADQTYFKTVKDFILKDFPGPVLKELANMVAKMMDSSSRLYGLEDEGPLVDLWVRVLTALPGWNRSKTVVYLLELCCERAFFRHTSGRVVRHIFCDIYKVGTCNEV